MCNMPDVFSLVRAPLLLSRGFNAARMWAAFLVCLAKYIEGVSFCFFSKTGPRP